MNNDEEHLKLLSIFHYVAAGLGALFSCLPLIHVGFGLLLLLKPEALADSKSGPPPAAVGVLFFALGAFLVLLGWGMAFCTFLSGRFLARKKHRMFSIVIGALQCLAFPLGTALGVFTLVVLSRSSVQELYARSPQRI